MDTKTPKQIDVERIDRIVNEIHRWFCGAPCSEDDLIFEVMQRFLKRATGFGTHSAKFNFQTINTIEDLQNLVTETVQRFMLQHN